MKIEQHTAGSAMISLCFGEPVVLLIRHPGGRDIVITAEAPRSQPPSLRLDMTEPGRVRQSGPYLRLDYAMPPAVSGRGGRVPVPAKGTESVPSSGGLDDGTAAVPSPHLGPAGRVCREAQRVIDQLDDGGAIDFAQLRDALRKLDAAALVAQREVTP